MDAILVPTGAEYQAVCRGLRGITGFIPSIIPIPVGQKAVSEYLQSRFSSSDFLRNISKDRCASKYYCKSKILVMGLCGSLREQYAVGDVVLYKQCIYQENVGCSLAQNCETNFSAQIYSRLEQKASIVTALTSNKVICSKTEKRYLAQTSTADIVDMEGFAILEFCNQVGIEVAMLRVVSDGCDRDIPNLNNVVSANGSLKPLSLLTKMLKQPIAASNLIRGSVKALKILEKTTTKLIQSPPPPSPSP